MDKDLRGMTGFVTMRFRLLYDSLYRIHNLRMFWALAK